MSAQVGKVAKQVIQQKRISGFSRWWAITRDLPELWVVYIGVGLAAGASMYTLSKVYFYDKSGSYLDPEIRGDPMKQEESGRVGGSDRNAEKASLWWHIAQFKNTSQGPDCGVSPFANYGVSRYNEPKFDRPGQGAPRAGGADVQKTPPLVG